MGPRVLVVVCLAALPLAACGTAGRERDAAAVSQRFHAALQSGDGAAACDELSEQARSTVEQQEGKACDEAILGMSIPKGGAPSVKRIEITSAYIGLAGGTADFLEEGPDGWKISATGCKPVSPDEPYECELEA